MRLPFFGKPRTRASVTDRLIDMAHAAASGGASMTSAADSAGAAVAAQLYAGALGGATIKSKVDFAPGWLAGLARDLILRGESLYATETGENGLSLVPVETWDISGGASEASWSFRCDIASPNGNQTRTLPREGLCFFRWAVDARKPWKGISPLQAARGMSSLAAKSAQSLSIAVCRSLHARNTPPGKRRRHKP